MARPSTAGVAHASRAKRRAVSASCASGGVGRAIDTPARGALGGVVPAESERSYNGCATRYSPAKSALGSMRGLRGTVVATV